MKLEDWEELTLNMDKGIIKLPIILDAPAHFWVLNIVDGFGPHTSSLKYMENYAKYKLLMLKEEGNTSHLCQRYYQYDVNQDKASFREDTSFLRCWVPSTRGALTCWCLVNVDLRSVKKLPR